MGDVQSIGLSAAQTEAYAALISRLGGQALTPLPLAQISAFGGASTVGWSVPLPADHTGSDRSLWIVLPASFPLVAPVVLVFPSAYGIWPHVTFGGALCLWNIGMEPVGKLPKEQISLVLERVGEVLKPIYSEPDLARIDAEFASEWLSYWLPRDGSIASASGLLLTLPPPRAAILPVISATTSDRRRFMLIGGDSPLAEAWMVAFGAHNMRDRPLNALYVPLARPLVGAPSSLHALKEVLTAVSPEAAGLLSDHLPDSEGPFFVVFGVAQDAPSFAALELTLVPDMRPQPAVRNAKEARKRSVRRKPDNWRLKVIAIDRADPAWIHGRTFDKEARRLAAAHVWVVGCGSLGGLVIRGLASAGVGRLTLVDDERLEVPNLGRHVLSARDLGRHKATALAAQIREQLPHLTVEGIPKKYPHARPSTGSDAPDLIISATANWPADLHLMAALANAECEWAQFTWAEPHAVVGHSVLASRTSDVRSLFNEDGRFVREATAWPITSTAIPGCAGSHQPGTFNRLQRIAGLAVEQAIAHLLEPSAPEHLAWLGDIATVKRLGGSWRHAAVLSEGVRERTCEFPIPTREP